MDIETQNLIKILTVFIINHRITISSIVSQIITSEKLDKRRLIVINHISEKSVMYKEIPISPVLFKIQKRRSNIIMRYIKIKDIEEIITSYDAS